MRIAGGSRDIPLLVRRGGRDTKKMPRSIRIGADGVVAHINSARERPPRPRCLTNR
jgi:hypothetical protein